MELAKEEVDPRVIRLLSKVWPEPTIENLSFFAMAAAVYARSVADPPYTIDVGRVLLRTAAFCCLRCARRKETAGGCMAATGSGRHQLPKCVKLPRDVEAAWRSLKRYIAAGGGAGGGDGRGGEVEGRRGDEGRVEAPRRLLPRHLLLTTGGASYPLCSIPVERPPDRLPERTAPEPPHQKG